MYEPTPEPGGAWVRSSDKHPITGGGGDDPRRNRTTTQITAQAAVSPEEAAAVDHELDRTWGSAIDSTLDPTQTMRVERPRSGSWATLDRLDNDHETLTHEADGAVEPLAKDADYELLEVLGRGGMGVVYKARQRSVDRVIALKMLKPGERQRPGSIGKFLGEASALADLEHPNIVPLHDIGLGADGSPFYVMKQVRGTPWSGVIRSYERSRNLDIWMAVADAVAYAHSRDIIHRDLKPSNVMLGEFGEIQLMDWGLAVSVAGTGKATALGIASAVGCTPRYAAPELAQAAVTNINVHTDVYLLGAILFEIITNSPPHAGIDARSCLRNAALNRIIQVKGGSELLAIALRAMRTEPSERFESIKALQKAVRDSRSHAASMSLVRRGADALARADSQRRYDDYARSVHTFEEALAIWGENQEAEHGLTLARQAYARCALDNGDLDLAESLLIDATDRTLVEQVARARRERGRRIQTGRILRTVLIILVATVVLILTVAFALVRMEQQRAVAAQAATAAALDEVNAEKQRAERLNYFNLLALAESKLQNGLFAQGDQLLDSAPDEYRHWEYGRLRRLSRLDQITIPFHGRGIAAIALDDHRGDLLIATATDRRARRWSLPGHRSVGFLGQHAASIADLAVDPIGDRIATGSWDDQVIIWDGASGESLVHFDGHNGPIADIAFSPDGQLLASASLDGSVKVWEVDAAEEIASWQDHERWARAAAWIADDRLATADGDGTVRLRNARNGDTIGEYRLHSGPINALAHHDGVIASAGEDGLVYLVNSDNRQTLGRIEVESGSVHAIAFDHSGDILLTAGDDRTLRAWDWRDGSTVAVWSGHRSPVRNLAVTKSGLVFSGSDDGTVKAWDLIDDRSRSATQLHNDAIAAIASSSQGFATGSWDGMIRFSPQGSPKAIRDLEHPGSAVLALTFGSEGKQLLCGHLDGTASWWRLDSNRAPVLLRGHSDKVTAVALDEQSSWAVSGDGAGKVRIWDLAQNTLEKEINANSGALVAVDILPGRDQIITGGVETTEARLSTSARASLRLWHRDGRLLQDLPFTQNVVAMVVDRDRRLTYVVGDENPEIEAIDLTTGTPVEALIGHTGPVVALALADDGARLASASVDGTIKIWDPQTGREVLAMAAPESIPTGLAFSGTDLIAVDADGVRWIWYADDWQRDAGAMAAGQIDTWQQRFRSR